MQQRPKAKQKSGRKHVYHYSALLKVLWRIWLEKELACGKRLKVAIPLWLPFHAKRYGAIDEQTQQKSFDETRIARSALSKSSHSHIGCLFC